MKDLTIDITTDVAEVVFDSIVDQGLLADLPVVGWAVKVARASDTISDKILLKKLEAFLNNFEGVSEAEKQTMRSRLESEEERERVGEKLVFVIESADELAKAKLLGKCFRVYLEEKITRDELLLFWHAVDQCYLDDLSFLGELAGGGTHGLDGVWGLQHTVLVDGISAYGGMVFKLSKVGERFWKVILSQN